jgi:hypothetical protein
VEEPTHQTQEETQVEEETIKSQLKINIRAKGMIISSIKCHYCKKYGHYIHECRKKQYDSKQQNENFIKENQNHGACFYLATLHKKIRRIYGF